MRPGVVRPAHDEGQRDPGRERLPERARHLGPLARQVVQLARVGLDAPGQWARPVIGMVSRMVDQKGLDLIFAAVAAGALQALDASFVILGTGAPKYEKALIRSPVVPDGA